MSYCEIESDGEASFKDSSFFFFFFLEKKRACFLEYLGSWSCFTLIRSLIVIVVARKTRVPLVLKRT